MSRAKESSIFKGILEDARSEIESGFNKAGKFKHKGIKGDERAAAIAEFFRQRLPGIYSVHKGEVVDSRDHQTDQLDVLIYDQVFCAPFTKQSENVIVPCEALYAVIEVKSILNKVHAKSCLKNAQSIRNLRPYKKDYFVTSKNKSKMKPGTHRVMYIVFAFYSDLGTKNWLEKEYARIEELSRDEGIELGVIDRIFVLDRGVINPPASSGMSFDDSDQASLLVALLVHLVNFLQREKKRRPEFDWQQYRVPFAPGFRKIEYRP